MSMKDLLDLLWEERIEVKNSLFAVSKKLSQIDASVLSDQLNVLYKINDIKQDIVYLMEVIQQVGKRLTYMQTQAKDGYQGYSGIHLDQKFHLELDKGQQRNKQTYDLEAIESQERQIVVEMDIYLADLKKFHKDDFQRGQGVVEDKLAAFALAYLKAIAVESSQLPALLQYKTNVYLCKGISKLSRRIPPEICQNPQNIKGLFNKFMMLIQDHSVRQLCSQYDLVQEVFELSLLTNLNEDLVNDALKRQNLGQLAQDCIDLNQICESLQIKYRGFQQNKQRATYQFVTKNGTVFILQLNSQDQAYIFQ